MTDKITLNDAATFDNSLLNLVNANNSQLRTVIDGTLSLNGATPNQMNAALDMNSFPIINLPAPVSPSSPARLQDVTSNNPINISVSLAGDVTAAANSSVLNTTVGKIKGQPIGTATPTSGQVLIADGTSWNSTPLSGVVTVDSTGATHLASNTVGNTNLQNNAVSLGQMATLAANSVIGNNTGSSATPVALSKPQLTAMVNNFSNSLSGTVPASGGGVVNFLRSDATWSLPQPPGRVLLNTLTAANSANLTDSTSFTPTYAQYEIWFNQVVPVTTNNNLRMLLHTGGNYAVSNYRYYWHGNKGFATSTATPLDDGSADTTPWGTYVPISSPSSTVDIFSYGATVGVNGVVRVWNPSQTAVCMVTGDISYITSLNTLAVGQFSAIYDATQAVDGFKISFSSGNISSGVIKVYGLT